MLITPPSSRIGTISPLGEDIKGPLSIDYGLELEAEFLLKMIFEIQESVYGKLVEQSSEGRWAEG
jgi:hypothetical protein